MDAPVSSPVYNLMRTLQDDRLLRFLGTCQQMPTFRNITILTVGLCSTLRQSRRLRGGKKVVEKLFSRCEWWVAASSASEKPQPMQSGIEATSRETVQRAAGATPIAVRAEGGIFEGYTARISTALRHVTEATIS